MDIKAIHKALTTIWPGGIPREGFVALAGMIKVLVDQAKTEAVTQEKLETSAQTQMEQALASIPEPQARPYVGTSSQLVIPVPVAPKARTVSPKILEKIKAHLALLSPVSKTQTGIAKALDLGPWTVKRAVWQLQKEKVITRTGTTQGPHTYQLARE